MTLHPFKKTVLCATLASLRPKHRKDLAALAEKTNFASKHLHHFIDRAVQWLKGQG